ncbi:glycosyltransferase family 2 protein [Caulobacter mirabilis]|uniref:Glycosyltransferase 2-like domain-containing protein n=1 Tax=Caulobacter mirabilis TaxID=69666 RepID=A0A2D2AZ72_9CAUL|nr:glycosyltransferase family 2 protein [Caulobacter mirabilis]ATQ43292.1 hypothetical protein CSW64_13120 [Caulobacter mirabilis]
MSASPDLSIVVCTYDRPLHLAETLRSCLAQHNTLGLALELVVIDNHPSGSAAAVVEALAGEAVWPIRYIVDLTRNMATLRNRGFAEARGRWLAFIDDDEIADPDWTDALVAAARATDAAVVVGPRLARFETGAPPAWDPTGAAFVRDLGLPDLAEIVLTTPGGKPRYGLGTGNSLFDLAHRGVSENGPMRESFGDAGGEDAELFVRMHRQNCKLVYAARARVTETVPEHRTLPAYRVIRVRRETQHYVTIYLDGAKRPRIAWAILMLKGVMQLSAGWLIAVATGEFRSNTRLRGRVLMAHGLGKLTWKQPIGYIQEPALNTLITTRVN